MVSIVESSQNPRATVLYNEVKLSDEQAIFLGAFNYWQDDHQLTLEAKLQRLYDLISLNERSLASTIHISLNFHPDEYLEDRKMRLIARDFLRAIDFGDQPALIYRHLDAGHPHAHIVTVNIRPDGTRIDNDKRAPHYLQKVCADLGRRHFLVPARIDRTISINQWKRECQNPVRVEYGKSPTKTSIEDVLAHVLPKYNYTTLGELNAVLSLYRVQADPGSIHGQMHQSGGLYYRLIDDRGIKVGAPIKASSLENRPTLTYLEQRFSGNSLARYDLLERMRNKVAISLKFANTSSLETWKNYLLREDIDVVTLREPVRRKHAPADEQPRQEPAIRPGFDGHGFYFVDFDRRAVIRDTGLGPEYTAESILRQTGLYTQLERLALDHRVELQLKQQALLQRSDPDPGQKLYLLLELSQQHDRIVQARIQEEITLRQQHRVRLSL
ncbi:MAG TPA: relaxase/mobilization nuclease domain-containing protein [Puia sp.]|jgi:hypothetical protein|nr:relaxase/mobilization nuclease domain-containing protein [Puia sp.]